MTVAENLALGGHGALRSAEAIARVHEVAALTGFALDADAKVEELPIGAQQRVEIAKALVRRATVLVLDEPTAVLAPGEADDLLRWLRVYAAGFIRRICSRERRKDEEPRGGWRSSLARDRRGEYDAGRGLGSR